MPEKKSVGASCWDVYCPKNYSLTIAPNTWELVPTGFSMDLPEGYEAQLRSRSGLALKEGIHVLNGIGTIDSDYTGHVQVILYNSGVRNYTINGGDRIAQMAITEIPKMELEQVDEIKKTDRGSGGFGSTGKN
jgi:dUTP pyrophosphatase